MLHELGVGQQHELIVCVAEFHGCFLDAIAQAVHLLHESLRDEGRSKARVVGQVQCRKPKGKSSHWHAG